MTDESDLRERIVRLGRSLFERGLTPGSSGNISVRLPDGAMLATPTNASLGFLDPARLSKLDANGKIIAGDPPTKEIPLHRALYDGRPDDHAIVHLHSLHSVIVSMLEGLDPRDAIPPLTPYFVMRVGRAAIVDYTRPGDPAVADKIRALEGSYRAVLLANHGPVVAGRTLEDAIAACEELEETARLFIATRNLPVRTLSRDEVADVLRHYG
jgi:ribulose-5-phosphate 4-epimerase/fuculose-1-phosphate aldolase